MLETVSGSDVVFAVTHNYTGYPLVRQAREMILGGELGEINAIRSQYIQGWLRTALESEDQKQAAWRTDPKRSGIAGAMGDIGTHAENLAEYITGLQIKKLCADLNIFVPGRQLDDDGNVLYYLTTGSGDPAGSSAPQNTWYFRSDTHTLYSQGLCCGPARQSQVQ